MTTSRVSSRPVGRPPTGVEPRAKRFDRALGHPLAFVATAFLILGLFGGTFVVNGDRVAPTKDPAYYTWRTEALISEDPATLLEIEGAFEMFAGGYRVAAPVIGGFLRRIPAISTLRITIVLMVLVPVVTSLLLASFAYRQRRDPLIWHAVALGSASLLLTPPFVGYLDNILCLMFLAAALPLLEPSRYSWGARAGLGLMLLMAGFTHPTTLVIFCLILGALAAVRLLFRRFDLRSVVRDDGPMLLTAFIAAAVTYLIWTIGPWGRSASLTEAALPPPYGSDFFLDRMKLWVDAMYPLLNGPLFLIGVIGLLVAGRRAADDDLTRVSIVWLAPLAGLFGFVGGLTYPYYRFFNTTLAWVLLIGLGIYFVARFLTEIAATGGTARFALLGLVALAAVIFVNFRGGFSTTGWWEPSGGWLAADERTDLDTLRAGLDAGDPARPVVFVIDDETSTFQIWGFTKLSGNTSRYGLPEGQIDRGYLYLGSLDNYLAGEPTTRGEETYDKLSPALLADTQAGIENFGAEPVVVLASIFNATGSNAAMAAGEEPLPAADEEIWTLHAGAIEGADGEIAAPAATDPGPLHIPRALIGFALLLLPGVLITRFVLPGATFAEGVGMAPALSVALLGIVGFAALAVVRGPMTPAVAWIALIVAVVAGAAAALAATRRTGAAARRAA